MKNTVCRFNFSQPISSRTFICRGENFQDADKTCQCNLNKSDGTLNCTCVKKDKKVKMDRDVASTILTKVKNSIPNNSLSLHFSRRVVSKGDQNSNRIVLSGGQFWLKFGEFLRVLRPPNKCVLTRRE